MNDSPQYGVLATTLAALQQRLARRDSVSFSASRAGEGPSPSLERSEGGEPINNTEPTSRRADGPGRPLTSLGNPAPILIGASKTQPVEMLEAAISLGLKDFGENRVQEAQAKWPSLKAKHAGVRLHLIGPLQSNKAADAVALFDVIQTVDRPKIADALAAACEKLGKRPEMLIQVNIGAEPQKAGVAPEDIAALLAHCQELKLPISGLMCVPPDGVDPAPYFTRMKEMADRLGLPELSMGMSGDFEIALQHGATMVRIGTALFGSRG